MKKSRKKVEQLRCGNCGEHKHVLLQTEKTIIVQCINCFNESEIVATLPKLDIKWVEGSNGLLAKF